MAGIDRLLELFECGQFVRPSADELNFADVAAAIVSLAGGRAPESNRAAEIRSLIGQNREHLVFVLVDGMGVSFLERLPADGFLRSRLAATYRTVFPPTTAAVLTTLSTCRWPAEHAVPLWWVYLEKFNLSAVSLRFIERFSEKPLEQWGVRSEDVFTVPSVWGSIKRDAATVTLAGIAESVYTKYGSGGTRRIGYNGIGEAFEITRRRVEAAAEPSFTYLYLPQVDSLCHDVGTRHSDVTRILGVIDSRLAALHKVLGGKAGIVVTADHGLLDTPRENRIIIAEGDEILSHLAVPPTGEPTLPLFHVHEGHEDAFVRSFETALGRHFALITPDEAEDLGLFGPAPLSPITRRRLGTFIGIAVEPAAVYYKPAGAQAKTHAAVHAGLTAEEMIVPLIIA